MHVMEVILPGGFSNNGSIQRQAKFKPLTGWVEQALIEFDEGLERPNFVTAVLSSVLDSIGDRAADSKCVSELCVADRQYLMLRLAAMLNGEQMWLKVACAHCDAFFDVAVRRCDLPVKEAGQDFPLGTLHLGEYTLNLRTPRGADQQQFAKLSDEQAMQQLLRSCITSVNGEPSSDEFINSLSQSDIEAIDVILDEVAPAVCTQLLVTCPECDQEQHAELDHYALDYLDKYYFYDEVHTLASYYHWSEAAILGLPQSKRRLYIDMINRSKGMAVEREMI